jgi:hypothetical protein
MLLLLLLLCTRHITLGRAAPKLHEQHYTLHTRLPGAIAEPAASGTLHRVQRNLLLLLQHACWAACDIARCRALVQPPRLPAAAGSSSLQAISSAQPLIKHVQLPGWCVVLMQPLAGPRASCWP